MRRFWKGVITLTAALVFLVALQPLYAQTSHVTAEVDRTDLTLYDTVTLTITVTGENNIGAPTLPSLSGLQLTGRKISSEQTFSNGQISAKFEFIYNLQPRHTGTIEIGPVSVTLGSDIHETSPITLNVTQGVPPTPSPIPTPSSPPISLFLRPSPNLGDPSFQSSADDGSYFVEAEVDNNSPYLGEQVTYISRFYSSNSYMARPIHRSPDFVGFWDPHRTDRSEYPDVVEGTGYSVIESSAILFPTLAGNISIEPSSVAIPSGTRVVMREHVSPPVVLQVKPLPMNEPSSFSGAVGKYDIEASVNAHWVELGDSLTLTATISGEGNFDTLPDPIWQDVTGWRAFENDSSYRTFVEDGILNGVKTFQRVLVPNAPGNFDLPPIEYSYFDPDLEQYVTASTDTISVRVDPDPSAAVIPNPVAGDAGILPVSDIRHIKPAPGGIGAPSDSILISPMFWGLGGLPLAALAALAVWRWVGARREAASRANSSARARELALNRLSDLDSTASGADAATAALHGYLSVILGRSSSALPIPELSSLLREHGINPDTIQRLEEILRELDEMRFAPHGLAQAGDESKGVAEIVRGIEREIHS